MPEESIKEELQIKKEVKVKGCYCIGWTDSWHQIELAQVMSHRQGNSYTGHVFNFCPWCGIPVTEVVVDEKNNSN
jgi:hypothetical protein